MRSLGQFQTFLFLYIFFFYEKISHTKKTQKAQKRTQANKNKRGSFKCA